MRILLFHNPKAGDREHRKKQLMAALAAFGHQPVYLSTKTRGWKKALAKSADVVVAAGGDGTVRKVAWHLMDTGIPLAILPLGTANNLARSLGFTAPVDEIIAHLRRGKTRTLDMGIARGSSGKRFFLEGSGGGLFADYMRGADLKEDKDAPKKNGSSNTSRRCAKCRLIIPHGRGRSASTAKTFRSATCFGKR